MNNAASLEDPYLIFLICGSLVLIGAAIIYATWRGVKWFVDPSADMLFVGTNLTLRKLIGSKGLRFYWYVFGGLCFVAGFAGFIAGLRRIFLGVQP